MKVVVDASAMIAYVRNEPGADLVARYLRSDHLLWAHALNLCEVYDFYRTDGQEVAASVIADLLALRLVERNNMDVNFWSAMGNLKAVHKRVSLADCAAITLTQRLKRCCSPLTTTNSNL